MFLEILQNAKKSIFAGIFFNKVAGWNRKLSEAAAGDVQWNKVFLKISQVSQECLSKKVAVLGACNFIKKDSNTGVFLWILWIIQEHLF